MRLAALEKMLALVRTIEPDAERCDVVKKINCLRTTYRKERKKVEASLQAEEDEVYKPTLWYYNMLTFLDDPITEGDNDGNNEASVYLDNGEYDEEVSYADTNDYTQCKEEFTESKREASKPASKRAIEDTSLANSVVNLLSEYIKRPKVEKEKEDRHDVFCKSIAMKMRYLDNHQRIMAEKLINDVMFEAELGNLNTDFRIARGNSSS